MLAVVKLTPDAAIKALISAIVPLRVKALAVPPTVTPPLLVALSVPLATERVTVTLPLPASTSANEIPVRAPGTSSVMEIEPGAVIVGASLMAVTCNVMTSLALCAPPLPVLPPSLMLAVSVTSAVALAAVVKLTLLPAIKVLMLLMLPVRVNALLVPPIVTPPPLVAARLPEVTDRVTVTELLPASTSLKLMPVMALGVSSVTPMVIGAVTSGASLTAVILTVLVAAVLSL